MSWFGGVKENFMASKRRFPLVPEQKIPPRLRDTVRVAHYMIIERAPASGSLLDSTGLDAIRAGGNAPNRSVDMSTDLLQVREKTPGNTVVRVAHVVSRHRFLATDFTDSCHLQTPGEIILIATCCNILTKKERGKMYFDTSGDHSKILRWLRKPVFLVIITKSRCQNGDRGREWQTVNHHWQADRLRLTIHQLTSEPANDRSRN